MSAAATEVALHTAIDEQLTSDAEAAARGLGVSLQAVGRDQPVGFHYFTPLSSPSIDGPGARSDALEVEDENVLGFGMVEVGRIGVRCKSLTIDPQRPRDLTGLSLEGFDWERLAIVCNASEARALGRDPDPIEAARKVRKLYGADTVVVKLGAIGAAVIEDSTTPIGVHPTASVWPIGSGDVFAGAFALAWGSGTSSVDAARAASAAAAWWCGTRAPNVPVSILEGGAPTHRAIASQPLLANKSPRVYLAGPFFDLAQRWLIELTRAALVGLGASVFSPLHDVGFGGAEVAAADLEGMNECDAVLALIDHWDGGTLFECGWAARAGIPVIAFGSDSCGEAAKMLTGTGAELHADLTTAAYRSVWAAMGMRPSAAQSS